MTAFPTEWQVHHDSQLVGFGTPTFADSDIAAICCVKLNPNGRLADSIRVSLSGTVLLCTRLPLSSLLNLPAPHNDYMFQYDVPLMDATPR